LICFFGTIKKELCGRRKLKYCLQKGDIAMEVFVARQPVFDKNEYTFGYELLYRNPKENTSVFEIDGDHATAEVIINSFLNIGIDRLSSGKPCFVNFTMKLLELELPTYFKPRDIIVEILEEIEPSQTLIYVCRNLKSLGYTIALDDFVFDRSNPYTKELMRYADIVKVDFLTTPESLRTEIETMSKVLNVKLLAEKVETHEEFIYAKNRGYDYFQGYFFSKPVVIKSHDVPSHFQSYYRVIQQLSSIEPKVSVIASIIEKDLSLSYKLLKLINSPAFRPKFKIHSIGQAIILLGLIEIQKWIYILAVRDSTAIDGPMKTEIIKLCMTRAKMCELIALETMPEYPASASFLTGMFSLMDTILCLPMNKILSELPLHEEICDALKGKENKQRYLLNFVIAFEKGEWRKVQEMSDELNLSSDYLTNVFKTACTFSETLLTSQDSYIKLEDDQTVL
jgi:c-di-GMP-related signal transduction protein